ncbi:MAG TPA: pseudouridine synthase [Actinomycetota bacterium]|nr:pseudouridine synthase [Actinomycetota bacterium]
MDGERLQKVLAAAGLGSRRVCDQLIADGRVSVDGVVAVPGVRVDPDTAVIHVDGTRIPTRSEHVVLAFHKPAGVASAMSDPRGRACVGDFVADRPQRLFHVGRLDVDTEGLLLLTNDGELANRIAHPSHGMNKTYVATVAGRVSPGLRTRLRKPVQLDDGPVEVDHCRIVDSAEQRSVVEVSLHEGRNRIVRRLFDTLGHPVQRLVRTQVGPVRLRGLAAGQMREITGKELRDLYTQAGL